jgi:hypothetical protein
MSGYQSLAPQPPRLGARAPGDTDPVLLDWTVQLGAYQIVTGAVVPSGGGGSLYAVGDALYGPNGSILAVASLVGSAVATVTIVNAGLCLSTTVPGNPVATTTNHAGVGATLALTWGAADTIASVSSTNVARVDGVAMGAGDLSVTGASIVSAGLGVMLTLSGGQAGVDYVIGCTIARASGPVLTRSVLQLVVSPLG